MQPSHPAQAGDATYRLIARRLLPFLFACYVVNFIDRVNIGFAKLQLLGDLGLNDAVFGVAAGMFFVGYVIFEVPSNLLMARVGVSRTLMRIMVLWGALTVALMFVRTATGLHLLRFLLGAAEAGFFPGLVFYLSCWFPSRLRARTMSRLVMAVPLAGIVGGPLSGWIMSSLHEVGGLRGWQWLFVVEGVPAIALGIAARWVLPDTPAQARWLSAAQQRAVEDELAAERAANPAADAHRLRDLVRQPIVYAFCAVYFAVFGFLNAVGFWVPSVLRSVGVAHLGNIGLLAGVISIGAAAGVLLLGHSSDRFGERRWHIVAAGVIAALAFLLLPLTRHNIALTTVLLLAAAAGIYGVLAVFWTIPTAMLQGPARAAGIALITAVGAVGGAVSPAIVGALKTSTGSLYPGLAVIATILLAGLALLLRVTPVGAGATAAGSGMSVPEAQGGGVGRLGAGRVEQV